MNVDLKPLIFTLLGFGLATLPVHAWYYPILFVSTSVYVLSKAFGKYGDNFFAPKKLTDRGNDQRA